jgi:hypothetical protein
VREGGVVRGEGQTGVKEEGVREAGG